MIKICTICKKEFEAKGSKKFCSDECKKNNNRERNKKWRQNNREKANNYTKAYEEKNKEKITIKQFQEDKKKLENSIKSLIDSFSKKYNAKISISNEIEIFKFYSENETIENNITIEVKI